MIKDIVQIRTYIFFTPGRPTATTTRAEGSIALVLEYIEETMI